MLTKQETLLGRGTQAEHRDENPGGLLCLMVCSLRPMVIGLVSDYLWPISLIQGPSWCLKYQSTKMDSSEKDSGRLEVFLLFFCFLHFTHVQLFAILWAVAYQAPQYGILQVRELE